MLISLQLKDDVFWMDCSMIVGVWRGVTILVCNGLFHDCRGVEGGQDDVDSPVVIKKKRVIPPAPVSQPGQARRNRWDRESARLLV